MAATGARGGTTFLSTPPHGRRPLPVRASIPAMPCFYPRLRMGGDALIYNPLADFIK